MTPKPFGYFNNPCLDGWQDCAETDEGARPLYDQDAIDALIAEHADIATLEQEARRMRARMERLEKERDDLLALLQNDAYAISFQTLGQYRGAIIATVKGGAA